MKKKAVIIGAGYGGLATALRLSTLGCEVEIIEKNERAGGRMNIIEADGFRFDLGPSFMSMTYELEELFKFANEKIPVKLLELNPLYQVFFEGNKKPFRIFKDLSKLKEEFSEIEPDIDIKTEKLLKKAGQFFHDVEYKIVKRNFENKIEYLLELTKVPKKYIPALIKNVWNEISNTFDSYEARVIFSLVAFFLGSTPFKTPAIYTLLNYTEMRHNGYWAIEGGMYKLVEETVKILEKRNVKFHYNSEIIRVQTKNDKIEYVEDSNGKKYYSDIFISNHDAADFRGRFLNRKKFSEQKLDKMQWTLAPFTMYLGIKGRINNLELHNYFLGNNFRGYADKIFVSSIAPQKPYYYVNAIARIDPFAAPAGCENIFILMPAPTLIYKPDYSDKEIIAKNLIEDLSKRLDLDLENKIIYKKILAPDDWAKKLNLYKGSGLGLSHGIFQVGAFRPSNKDEKLKNLYYVGASTTPGTGIPMVIISSRLTTERIIKDEKHL